MDRYHAECLSRVSFNRPELLSPSMRAAFEASKPGAALLKSLAARPAPPLRWAGDRRLLSPSLRAVLDRSEVLAAEAMMKAVAPPANPARRQIVEPEPEQTEREFNEAIRAIGALARRLASPAPTPKPRPMAKSVKAKPATKPTVLRDGRIGSRQWVKPFLRASDRELTERLRGL